MDDLDEIQRRLEEEKQQQQQQAEAYAKQKAEAETREISTIMQDTSKTLQVKLNQKVAERIETSAEIDEKITNTTNTLVDIGLGTQQNQVEAEYKKSQKDKALAEFELNEDQYRAFGLDTSPEEKWKKKLIKYGYNFWFVVISFICFLSLAPFYVFTKIIKTQSGVLKFVAIVIGILLLLVCLGALTYGVLGWTNVI